MSKRKYLEKKSWEELTLADLEQIGEDNRDLTFKMYSRNNSTRLEITNGYAGCICNSFEVSMHLFFLILQKGLIK